MADDKIPSFAELREMFRDTAERFKETDGKFKETDGKFKETDKKFKETDAKIDRVCKELGALGRKWGTMAEAMTLGDALPILNTCAGIEVRSLHHNIESADIATPWEIDAIAIGPESVVVIEAKSSLDKEGCA